MHYSRNRLQAIWNAVRTKANIDKGLRLYDATRHSFASQLVNSNPSIYHVSRLLGHSNVKMTEKYAHSNVDSLRTNIKKLTLQSKAEIKNIARKT